MFGRPWAFKNGQNFFLRWSKEVKKGPSFKKNGCFDPQILTFGPF